MGTKEQKKGQEGCEIGEPHTLTGRLRLHQRDSVGCLKLPGKELKEPWGVLAPASRQEASNHG